MAQIIGEAVPSDRNVAMKEKEKIKKCKDLCVELSSLCKVLCEVISLVIGGLGSVSNMLQGYSISFILYTSSKQLY